MNLKAICAQSNRGVLLDVVVFVLNLVVMPLLVKSFVDIVKPQDNVAKLVVGLFFLGMLVLPAAGAVLKRRDFHQRRNARRDQDYQILRGCLEFGCLLSCLIAVGAGAFFGELIFGEDYMDAMSAISVPVTFGCLVLGVIQTYVVISYFRPPETPSKRAFWRDQGSAVLGDMCILANMILFQILWSVIIATIDLDYPTRSFPEVAFRPFVLWFFSILLYMPSRIFYLAEDIDRPTSWLTILLANYPLVLYYVYGVI